MFQILISAPSPEILNALRAYISFVRHFASFDVNDEMQTFVQEDFVRERSTDQVQIHIKLNCSKKNYNNMVVSYPFKKKITSYLGENWQIIWEKNFFFIYYQYETHVQRKIWKMMQMIKLQFRVYSLLCILEHASYL